MTTDLLFQLASQAAMAGWVLIAAGMFAQKRWADGLLLIGGRIIPLGLCVGYALAILVWWGGADGGFGSLDAVGRLFTTKGLLLAGWVHYLAFDLLVGRWEVDRTLSAASVKGLRWLTLPCLAATFMFGPVGLLLFLIVSGAWRNTVARRVAA